MRILGIVLVLVGFLLCVAIEDWEASGLIPIGIGIILVTVAKKHEEAFSLAETKIERTLPPPKQNQLLADETVQLSPEVLQLLERLSRNSKPR